MSRRHVSTHAGPRGACSIAFDDSAGDGADWTATFGREGFEATDCRFRTLTAAQVAQRAYVEGATLGDACESGHLHDIQHARACAVQQLDAFALDLFGGPADA